MKGLLRFDREGELKGGDGRKKRADPVGIDVVFAGGVGIRRMGFGPI